MSDKIKGSDGIERTIEEWRDFISQRATAHSAKNKDRSWSISRQFALFYTDLAFNEKHAGREADKDSQYYINTAANHMSRFYREAAQEAGKKITTEGRWDILESTMKSFSKQCKPDQIKFDVTTIVGVILNDILEEQGSFLESRKKLRLLISLMPGMADVSERDISRSLEWYQLEGICRDNTKG